MTDKETKFDEVIIYEGDDSTNFSAETFLRMGKRKLLEQKDALIRADKAAENRDKRVLQELLKSSTRSKHFFLENRRDALPWLSRYESIRSTMKKSKIQDWRTQLLNIARESLRNKVDIEATRYMDNLKHFEKYIESTYIIGLSLIDDLLSDIVKKDTPKSTSESITNIQDCILCLNTIRSRDLTHRFTERHFELLLDATLMKRDQMEFRKEYAREKVEGMGLLSSKRLGDSDSSDEEVDFDKSVKAETGLGSLDNRREFFTKYLKTKLVQLKDIEASVRTRGEKVEVKKSIQGKRVRFGDKLFVVNEVEDSDNPELEDFDNLDSVFSGFDKKSKNLTKKNERDKGKKKHPKKPCPLKCEKGTHSYGSLFFCPLFRDKSKEERKLIQEKTHICLKCLAKVSNCGAPHNILM